MEINLKFKSNDEAYFMLDGSIQKCVIQYVDRIEYPGTAGQRVYYCVAGVCKGLIRREEDLYSSIEEAKAKIFKYVE